MSDVAGVWYRAYREHAGQVRLAELLDIEENKPARIALMDLGCTVARVTLEARSEKPEERDDLAPRSSLLAPQWRECAAGESGIEAILLPVAVNSELARAIPDECTRCMDVLGHRVLPPDPLTRMVDVIAITASPLRGRRPSVDSGAVGRPEPQISGSGNLRVGDCYSLTGMTGAVGTFAVLDGKCRIVSSGINFLERHIARVIEHGAEFTPDRFETLLVDRTAFEWRLSENPVIVPSPDVQIACVDSRELALWIAAEMKKRRPARKAPEVVAPKEERAA